MPGSHNSKLYALSLKREKVKSYDGEEFFKREIPTATNPYKCTNL